MWLSKPCWLGKRRWRWGKYSLSIGHVLSPVVQILYYILYARQITSIIVHSITKRKELNIRLQTVSQRTYINYLSLIHFTIKVFCLCINRSPVTHVTMVLFKSDITIHQLVPDKRSADKLSVSMKDELLIGCRRVCANNYQLHIYTEPQWVTISSSV